MDDRNRILASLLLLAFGAAVFAQPLLAQDGESASHANPIARVALGVAIILVLAKIGGEIAIRLGQPSVLGELLAGIVLGNLTLAGYSGLEWMKADASLEMLGQLGVLLLVFEVGLESTVPEMLRVGLSALFVASFGVFTPFLLGWAVGVWLLPAERFYAHLFLGAALCATSIGITARVLKDLKKSSTKEGRIILGAAVLDDVFGLIILAVVTGLIAAANGQGQAGFSTIGMIVLKATVFLSASLAIGVWAVPRLLGFAAKLREHGILLAFGLAFCLFLSWAADAAGLAAIVGAFAAGLILEDVHYRDFVNRGEKNLRELIHPIASFVVPVFFVVIGMHTDVRSFVLPGTALLAAALTVAAILGKQACGLGIFGKAGRGLDRLSIGIAMIPRGEVGLIFANIGATLVLNEQPVITPPVFSAVVVMVILTTMLTPPALQWSLSRKGT